MEIKSIFQDNGEITSRYACDGDNISPPLEITSVPPEARSLALIMDDPDAPSGTFVHWLVWNIPINNKSVNFGEGARIGKEGKNGTGTSKYIGPCPPSGTHRYFFKVYALDIELDLEEGSTKEQLKQAIEGHILERAILVGLYSRRK